MTQFSKRFLLVGSLLRPDELQTYNREIESRDDITYPFYDDLEGYKETEAKATQAVIDKQLDHHIPEVTDGEFQRSIWHLDFVWGLEGIERYIYEQGWQFQDSTDEYDEDNIFETRKDIGLRITGPIHSNNHPFIDHYKQVVDYVDGRSDTKLTIPAPAQIYSEIVNQQTDDQGKYSHDIYPTQEELGQALVNAWKEFIDEYVAVGGSIIQLDDCTWTFFSQDNPGGIYAKGDLTDDEIKAIAQSYVDLNNAVVDYAHEKGLKVYTHNCRGNYSSRNFTEGSYEDVAHFFLSQQNYDRFYLEWDDDRAGNISALQAFKDKPETEVVVGFLSSKLDTLEDKDEVLAELEEAAKYIPKDKLYLSHQCGFASCDGGNELSHDQQWEKIDQGHEIAFEFFGE